MTKYILSIAIILSLFSCSKSDDPAPDNSDIHKGGIFILNEGNYSVANSSLSYYYPDVDTILNSLFYKKNNVPLGDIAQSITIFNDMVYIVVNNSGLIYIIDNTSLEFEGKISNLTSPREILILDNEKAYVSDLYNNSVTIINPITFEKTGSINVGKSTDCLVSYGDFVFAANWSALNGQGINNTIRVIDTKTNLLSDTIIVGLEPNSMKIDKNGHLWVLCSGGYLNEELPTLWKINPVNLSVIQTLTFGDITHNPINLCINSTGDSLFFINTNIYRMSITDTEIPENSFISASENTFYTMDIDPNSGELYVSDALDYNQNGLIYRYNSSGKLVTFFEAGIIPGCIYFNY